MVQKIIAMAAIATSMSSGYVADRTTTRTQAIEAHETRIEAVWTCDAARPLATDYTATVRDCRWIVR